MDGIATLWPEQMTKCMVIEKNKQTNKQTNKTNNKYVHEKSINKKRVVPCLSTLPESTSESFPVKVWPMKPLPCEKD